MTETLTFTPKQQRILDAVAAGVDARQAAAAAGVSAETLWRWREIANGAKCWPGTDVVVTERTRTAITNFVRALPQAEAEGFERLVSRLQHNANTLNPKTGWYDTQAADKLLSKSSFRKFWYEREPEQDPARALAPAYIEAQSLTTAELEASLAADDDGGDQPTPGGAGRGLGAG